MAQNALITPEFIFVCPLPNGFHARPASYLVNLANDFAADCVLTNLRNGQVADIKSVLSILTADIQMNDECRIRVNGADEQAASTALQRFIGKDLPGCDVPLADFVPEEGDKELPRPFRAQGLAVHFGFPVSRGIGYGKVVVIRGMEALPTHEPESLLNSVWEGGAGQTIHCCISTDRLFGMDRGLS